MKKYFLYYDLILAAFVLTLLISNLAATKLITVGSLILDGGALLFPLTYIFGDVLTEVYGYRYARRAIWSGFAGMLLAIVTFTIVGMLPYPAEYTAQSSYEAVLGFLPRIVLASLSAYLVGEFLNSYVLVKLKARTGGKRLWLRLIGSTLIGEFFDTIIFCLIAFGGILSGMDMLNYILVGWLFKCGVEVVMLPITYRVIRFLKKAENVDANDKKANLTPFSMSLQK
jgi:uncharacterized integral membrane protein (TIGR00697 family)